MGTMPFDAVIFDLDGTLFDSKEAILCAVKASLDDFGYTIPENFNTNLLIGPPLKHSLPAYLGIPEERVDAIIANQRRIFWESCSGLYRVYPGIRRILQTLQANGVFVAVATANIQDIVTRLLRQYHMDTLVDMVSGETDSGPKLGKTKLLRRILDKGFRRPVMVGDRHYDIIGAAENQIESIGVFYGYGSREELWNAGARYCVNSTEELFTLLCGDARPPKGFFLSIEGPDGSGKSTQIRLLTEKLIHYGFDLYQTREPGGCPISEAIRGIVLDPAHAEMCASCEALLYAAARAQHVHQVILPKLKEGKLVLSDRFVDSSVAYQGGARHLGVAQVQAINGPAVEGCLPDATLYLAMDAKDALARRLKASSPDRLEAEDLSFHQRVQTAYEEIIAKDTENRFLVVDANRPPEAVAEDAWEKVLNRIAPLQSVRRSFG